MFKLPALCYHASLEASTKSTSRRVMVSCWLERFFVAAKRMSDAVAMNFFFDPEDAAEAPFYAYCAELLIRTIG